MKRRWVQGMLLAGMLILTGCGAKNSSPVENGKDYTWNDITVMLPEDWADRCTIKEDENGFTIYQTASYEKMEGLGYLCSFEKSDAWMNYSAREETDRPFPEGRNAVLPDAADGCCVRYGGSDNRGEYGSMMEEVTAIASSVKIDADDVHYDARSVCRSGWRNTAGDGGESVGSVRAGALSGGKRDLCQTWKNLDDTYLQAHFDACSWYTPAGERLQAMRIK